ncbi:MAG: 50S ribosomal protein L32 [Deferribacterales bacterium]|nr:50S ribosomal protein L32 [Deferribacterales bacterium]
MPNPKHKVTKSKVGMRRSHHHTSPLQAVKCDKCGELKQAHTVCPACGSYKGEQVITKKEV